MSGRPRRINPALVRKHADQAVLRRLASARDRDQSAVIMGGPHGDEIRALIGWMRAMTIRDGRLLAERIRTSSVRAADDATRRFVLRLVGDAIVRVRAREGLPPADDPLPGQPPNAFAVIRDMLRDRFDGDCDHG